MTYTIDKYFFLNNFYFFLIITVIFVITNILFLIEKFHHKFKILINNKKKKILWQTSVGFIIGLMNAIVITTYLYFDIDFLIMFFIPIILLIFAKWNTLIGLVSLLPSLIMYYVIGYFKELNVYQTSLPLLILLIGIISNTFINIYKIEKIIPTILINFSIIFINILLYFVMLKEVGLFTFCITLLFNLFSFLLYIIVWNKSIKFLESLIRINNLSYFENEYFLNSKQGIKEIKKKTKDIQFGLNIKFSFDLISSQMYQYDNETRDFVVSELLKQLQINLYKYKPIFYIDLYGHFSCFIDISDHIKDFKMNNLFKSDETKNLIWQLSNFPNSITIDQNELPIKLQKFMSIYGIHSNDIYELQEINNYLYKYGYDQEFILYKPHIHDLYIEKINILNILKEKIYIDKLKIELDLSKKTIITPKYKYLPLLYNNDEVLFYFKKINLLEEVLRYLFMQTINAFSNLSLEEKHKRKIELIMPVNYMFHDNFNVNKMLKKLERKKIKPSDIVLRINFNEVINFQNYQDKIINLMNLGFKFNTQSEFKNNLKEIEEKRKLNNEISTQII